MACNSKVQVACIYSILTGVKATEQAPPPQACVLLVASCAPRDAGGFLGVPTGWEQSPETCASWAWGLGPSGGCWWEVRDKFWLLSGPLPTAVPRGTAASPTGRWSGLQLSLPKRFLEPVSESISTETLILRKRLDVFGN